MFLLHGKLMDPEEVIMSLQDGKIAMYPEYSRLILISMIFATACFKPECQTKLYKDIVSEKEQKGLQSWVEFYAKHQKYFPVGRLKDWENCN